MGGFIRELRLLRDRVSDFESYPYSIPAIRHLDSLVLDPSVTFLVGENGSGKSTLVEAIAILAGLNPEGGSKHFNYSLRPSESKLSEAMRLVRDPSGSGRPSSSARRPCSTSPPRSRRTC